MTREHQKLISDVLLIVPNDYENQELGTFRPTLNVIMHRRKKIFQNFGLIQIPLQPTH